MSVRVACDGNEATATSAYNVSETAIIFPITPSLPWESIATPGPFRDVRIYLDSVYK